VNDPLAQLQDIHLPLAIGLWPPAPGWWLLLLLIVAAGALLGWYLRRRSKCLGLYRSAMQELDRIRRQFIAQPDSSQLAEELSRLLRSPHIFVFTVLIGNNIAIYLLSKEVTDLYLDGGMAGQTLFGFIPWNAEMAATLTLVFPLFIFGTCLVIIICYFNKSIQTYNITSSESC